MRILITGGAGYIGSHAVKLINQHGFDAITYDNLENGHKESLLGGKLIQGDLRDREQLFETFGKYRFGAVIHFAAYASVGDSVRNPAKYFLNNVTGGINLLEAMRIFNVPRMVFSSSAATYGEPASIPVREDDAKNPTNPYGETKLQFEKILKWYDIAYDIKYVSLRYFNASGADPDGKIGEDHYPEDHLIPTILQVAMGKTESVKIFGNDWDTPDGTCVRDFIHVSDIAEAHIKALRLLEAGMKSNEYNMGNGDGQSVMQIIKAAKDVTGINIPWEATERRPGDPARLVASSEKIKRDMEWEPRFPDLHTIIEHAWRWHRDHPNGYSTRK